MHINKRASKRESEHMRGEWAHEKEGGNTATGPVPSQVAPITAATTPSPAAMAAAAGTAAVSVTARMVTVVTVGRASEKEVWCT